MDAIRRRSDGSIDCEFYVRQSRERRAKYTSEAPTASETRARQPKRHIKVFGAALALATGAFLATMAISPPSTEAAVPPAGPGCRNAGQGLAIRLEREATHAKWMEGARPRDLNRARTGLEAARRQCEAGLVSVSLANYGAVDAVLARLEAARPITD
jgi:hypothetical protein